MYTCMYTEYMYVFCHVRKNCNLEKTWYKTTIFFIINKMGTMIKLSR